MKPEIRVDGSSPRSFRLAILPGWLASVLFFACLLAASRHGWGHDGVANAMPTLEQGVDRFVRLLPRGAVDLATFDAAALEPAARAVDDAAAAVARFDRRLAGGDLLGEIGRLLAAKTRIDAELDSLLAWRGAIAKRELVDEAQRPALRQYLVAAARLTDLSGRLRYALSDALREAVDRLAAAPAVRAKLVEQVVAAKSSIGATALAGELEDRAAEPEDVWRPLPAAARMRVLDAIAESRQVALLPNLVEFLKRTTAAPELRLRAAETIRAVGLPQDPRPGADDALAPAITAAALRQRVASIAPSRLNADWKRRRGELLRWLDERLRAGTPEETYRVGAVEVRAGDWLLMRNPSPFNQFTDLSPGLYTHVGVVTVEKGADGKRRFAVVDLPEQGTHIPATNVEAYLQRTLNYVFLRHPNLAAAQKMGDAAREAIGNPSQFDLNFRTERVEALAKKPLAGERIHTYCAGLLLLVALQTDVPRADFFPVDERPARGQTVANLAKLGVSVGDGFISPTGAMFSPVLEIVGRREPMYDPTREIEEAVFDHFARQLQDKTLVESPDLFQWLRQRAADASRDKPALAKLLAEAAKVNENTDLAAAARAASVIETLDEAAFGASGEFAAARRWLRAPPLEEWAQSPDATAQEKGAARKYQTRHAELFRDVQQDQVSPRGLRQSLVEYYIQAGKKSLDGRFFSPKK